MWWYAMTSMTTSQDDTSRSLRERFAAPEPRRSAWMKGWSERSEALTQRTCKPMLHKSESNDIFPGANSGFWARLTQDPYVCHGSQDTRSMLILKENSVQWEISWNLNFGWSEQPPQSLQASPHTKMDVINVTILHRFWCCFECFHPHAFRFVAICFWTLYSWMRRSVKSFITGIPSYLSNWSFLSNQCWIAPWIAASLSGALQTRTVSMTITPALCGCGTSTENSQAHPDGSCHGPVIFWIHPRPLVFSTSFKTFVQEGDAMAQREWQGDYK